MPAAANIRIKRVYEDASRADGTRLLVDRLWPRGVSKERAAVDEWLRDIAPSTGLRKWFGHDPERFAQFRKRYRAELVKQKELLKSVRQKARDGGVTLLYAAHDPKVNHAVVLRSVLLGRR
jgi:uncharacterized protein YeaO (DUF488 family)